MSHLKETRTFFTLKIFWKAFGSYKYRIALLVLVGFLGGLFEGIGINSIIPLFSFVVKDQSTQTDTVSRYTQKIFTFLHIPYELKYLLLIIALLFIGKSVMTFLTNYITDRTKTDYVRKTRNRIFGLTLQSNWTYLSKQKIGHLEKVLITDINNYTALFSYVSSTVSLIINVAIYSVISFAISPPIISITIVTGGLFFILSKPLVYRVRLASYQSSDTLKNVANHINESMLGIKTIKAMNLENAVVDRGQFYFKELQVIEMKLSVLSSLSYVATQPLSVLLILGLFAYSYKLTTFNLASFAVIVYAINKIFTYIQDAQTRLQSLNALYPFLKSASDYEVNATKNQERQEGLKKVNFVEDISFKNVSFSYSGEHATLSKVNFSLPHGTVTGIIGPSGAGKTTLVDLLLQLINPSEGQILLGTVDTKTIERDIWRNHIGYVSQDVFLINDTVENNIKLHSQNISDADMIYAAKMANIHDFIMTLPQGFKTQVGERGMEMSGGQRQRIALARVLARKPEIIILDEATSALDNESEALIQKAIESLRGKATIIIIAHRPTTVKNADTLLVLKDGQLVETGRPDELSAKEDSYFHKILASKH